MALLGFGLGASSTGSAADWLQAPITGEIAGDFQPLNLPGAPKVHLRLSVRAGEDGARDAAWTAEGPATAARGQARLHPDGRIDWQLAEARIDLAAWVDAVAPTLGEDYAGLAAAGTLTIAGVGTWREHALAGRARLTVQGGRLEDPALKLTLEGVALELEFEDLAARRSAAAQRLSWTGGTYDVLTLGAGEVVFAVVGDEIRVQESRLAALGGELSSGPFTLSLSRPEFTVDARLANVEVAELLPLLPKLVAAARGRLDGQVRLHRDAAGISIGAGQLSLRSGQKAEVRLLPTPGLISTSLPEAVKKYYTGIDDLEGGRVPLVADRLEVSFTPEGDAQGRTASVRIAGGPQDPRLKAPVDLTVNIRGPLQQLIRFATDSRLRFGGK